MTFAPATIAPVVNANVQYNPNPNPNPNLYPYPTLNQSLITEPNHYPHSNSLLLEIMITRALVARANVAVSCLLKDWR